MNTQKSFVKILIPILISSLTAYIYCLGTIPLGYMYNSFPGKDNLTVLVATLPGLTAMIGAFACAPLMSRINKKVLIIAALSLATIGGLGIYFIGNSSLILCIVASSLTGFTAGVIPSVNYVVLSETAPETYRTKVCGWSDAAASGGLLIYSFLAGILSADGNWARAYMIYFVLIPIIAIVVLFYPGKYEVVSSAEAEESADSAQKDSIPGSVMGLIIIKFLSSFFILATSLNISDLIINERHIGTTVLVGNASTIFNLVQIVIGIMVFAWLKTFKGASTVVSYLFIAASMFLIAVGNPSAIMICVIWAIGTIGNGVHSVMSTLCTQASSGKAIGLASSLFIGATFVGEFLCGYFPAIASKLFFGVSTPSNNLLASAIMLVFFGLISYPFSKKAYKLAFEGENQSVE